MGALGTEHNRIAGWLSAIDRRGRSAEVVVACAVLLTEVTVFVSWVLLKGLSSPPSSESEAGWMTRAAIGSIALGGGAALAFRRAKVSRRAAATAFAALAGAALAPLWRGALVDYTSNLLNWLQQASALTLFGGLRGVGTRLTVLLLFIGGGLATGKGRHITIDLVTRALGPRARRAVHVAGASIGASICAAAGWGFFDHIAIEDFHARMDDPASSKVATVAEGVGEHAYALQRQLGLDVRSVGHVVLRGEPYAEWFSGLEWNAFVEGLSDRYGAEAAAALRIGPAERRAPMVVLPGVGEPRGELVKTANLVFPIGLAWLSLRFLLLALRLVVDPTLELDKAPPEGALGTEAAP